MFQLYLLIPLVWVSRNMFRGCGIDVSRTSHRLLMFSNNNATEGKRELRVLVRGPSLQGRVKYTRSYGGSYIFDVAHTRVDTRRYTTASIEPFLQSICMRVRILLREPPPPPPSPLLRSRRYFYYYYKVHVPILLRVH